ncbi:hypothetical protein IWZ00DRAFT_276790 [Phyllosticta capitalensis]|uniref:Uncharacterized protein n=1 Tax=Phyllosticta capitalensis TaxID=121624 RepID=A0ABR1YPR6_9PEZI
MDGEEIVEKRPRYGGRVVRCSRLCFPQSGGGNMKGGCYTWRQCRVAPDICRAGSGQYNMYMVKVYKKEERSWSSEVQGGHVDNLAVIGMGWGVIGRRWRCGPPGQAFKFLSGRGDGKGELAAGLGERVEIWLVSGERGQRGSSRKRWTVETSQQQQKRWVLRPSCQRLVQLQREKRSMFMWGHSVVGLGLPCLFSVWLLGLQVRAEKQRDEDAVARLSTRQTGTIQSSASIL